jgi:hypothetical protein
MIKMLRAEPGRLSTGDELTTVYKLGPERPLEENLG